MLTRVLFALVVTCGLTVAASAENASVVKLGIAAHEVTQEELGKGAPPVPKFNTPALAYVLLANLKKGDAVEVALVNETKALLTNSAKLDTNQATFLLQAGKRGVPAGGWPQEWKYSASVKVTRDGKTLLEQKSDPIPFE